MGQLAASLVFFKESLPIIHLCFYSANIFELLSYEKHHLRLLEYISEQS